MNDWLGGLCRLEEWLHASVSHARRELPDLLDRPVAVLERELANRPELQTAGVLKTLIDQAQGVMERLPRRAHELTSMAVAMPIPEVSGERAVVITRLQAVAWKEHGRALYGLGQADAARAAFAKSRSLLARTPVHHWYVATVDLLEAPLLHEAGDAEAALELVLRAAEEFAIHHDYEHLVEARMHEMWMHVAAGRDIAAAEVWTQTAGLAEMRRHPALLARMSLKAARVFMRHDDLETATRMLEDALEIFDREALDGDAIAARWQLAEALTARGRLHEAISEFHKLRATLLTAGRINDAAIASTEIVELLLTTGRDAEIPAFASSLPEQFRSDLAQNALEALTFLAARAAAETLTRDEVTAVRHFFEDLPQQPKAWFSPPS